MTGQERKTRKKIEKILNNYTIQWDGLDSYQLCVSELEKLTTKVSRVELPVKPAKAGKRVFEQNIVNKMEGKPENELSNDAEIRFELDNVKYNVKINDDDELEIYKIALKYTQQDQIVLKAKSQNVICIG